MINGHHATLSARIATAQTSGPKTGAPSGKPLDITLQRGLSVNLQGYVNLQKAKGG